MEENELDGEYCFSNSTCSRIYVFEFQRPVLIHGLVLTTDECPALMRQVWITIKYEFYLHTNVWAGKLNQLQNVGEMQGDTRDDVTRQRKAEWL